MKTVVVVNPYKLAGHAYCYELQQVGLRVTALWTGTATKTLWERDTPDTLIDDHMIWDDATYAVLKEMADSIGAFIPADDDGARLADTLQQEFFPHNCNNKSLLHVRASKFEYLKHLKEEKLVTTQQDFVKGDSVPFFKEKRVLKPINGAGNENVYVVNSDSEAKDLVTKHSGVEFMLQDYVEGEEFCVELCTSGDKSKCTTVMKYGRKYLVDECKPWRYDNDLVDPDTPEASIVTEYARKINKALGVRVGMTWTQVILRDNEPYLVEVNFRGQGHGHLFAVHSSTGTNYAIESIRAYLAPNRLNEDAYVKTGEFKKLCVNNKRERHIQELDVSVVSSLPSVVAVYPNRFVIPSYAEKSNTFKNTLAMIIMYNSDKEQFNKDFQLVTEWQKRIE